MNARLRFDLVQAKQPWPAFLERKGHHGLWHLPAPRGRTPCDRITDRVADSYGLRLSDLERTTAFESLQIHLKRKKKKKTEMSPRITRWGCCLLSRKSIWPPKR